VSLAQLQLRVPDEPASWHTQYPVLLPPPESLYVPPGRPPVLLHSTQWSTVQADEAAGTPAGQAAFAAVGIL